MRGRLRYRSFARVWIGVPLMVASSLVASVWVTAAALGLSAILLAVASRIRRLRGRRWPSGRRVRVELGALPLAGISWVLATAASFMGPPDRVIRTARELHQIRAVPALILAHGHLIASWRTLVDLLVAGALISSLLAVRSLRRPQWTGPEASQITLQRVRAIVDDHGEDSLSPFILRPDKSFEFSADAVAAYRLIGETAIVSGDPVGPHDSGRQALEQLLRRAHQSGVQVVVYGASERHLDTYRALGLRTLCVGEEAIVHPSAFTLEGRSVRKLRQSVNRVQRRGWRIAIYEGRDIDHLLEAEIERLEALWRQERGRLLGFTMSMGEFGFGVRPGDLYALAWSPQGRLQAVIRFLANRENFSLDMMRRVGETPNGLNEALVARALEFARGRGVAEVSLNYAGLGHLVRGEPDGGWLATTLTGLVLKRLRRRFQMDRLVLFNEKFSPHWRRRYLAYDSRAALPRSVLRILQAEGYLQRRRVARTPRRGGRWQPASASEPVNDGLSG